MCQSDVLSDMLLEVLHSVQPQDEPKLERSEPSSERDLPVAVIGSGALLVVFQVKRVDVEGVDDPPRFLEPHRGAVEVDQHPLVRVEVEGARVLYAFHEVAVFRADEGRASVRGVHVQPDVALVAHVPDLVQGVECA